MQYVMFLRLPPAGIRLQVLRDRNAGASDPRGAGKINCETTPRSNLRGSPVDISSKRSKQLERESC